MWMHIPGICFHSAPASEELNSASNWRYQMLAPSVSLSGRLLPATYWRRKCKMVVWMKHLFGQTCEHFKAARGVASWIASLPDSHVSRSVEPVEGTENHTSIGCGKTSPELSEKSSPPLYFVKMSMPSGRMVALPSWLTLPHAGSILRGTYFPLVPLEPHILARDSSFSPQNGGAWTTPCSDDVGVRKSKYSQGGKPLSLQIREYCQQTLGYEPHGQNPDFREALMGLPIGWTDFGRWATPLYQKWLAERSQG